MFIIFLIVLLDFENFDNNQKLAIVRFILSFYKNHFFQKNYYQMPLAQICFNDYFIKISFKR